MSKTPKVLVIIPCYNEAGSILQTVKSLRGRYDYLVVNDCSTDSSLKILRKHRLNHLTLPSNLGIGGCVQTGYRYALEHDYDIAVQFDGDGQHDANYIPKIIEPIVKHGANLVVGSRFVGHETDFKSTTIRRFGITFLSKLFHLISKQELHDITSGFRAVDRKVMSIFAEVYPAEYPEPVTDLTIARSGFKIDEVPVKMHPRTTGTSSITPLKSAYYIFNVLFLYLIAAFSKKPSLHGCISKQNYKLHTLVQDNALLKKQLQDANKTKK